MVRNARLYQEHCKKYPELYGTMWYEIAFLIPLGIDIFGKGLQQGESFCPQSKFYHQAIGPKKLQLHLKKYTRMVA